MNYDFIIFGSVEDGFTSAEIETDDGTPVGRVFESASGWHVELPDPTALRDGSLVETIIAAQQRLLHYPNRLGNHAPQGLSGAGLSFWLMERDDGLPGGDAQ